MQKIIVAAKSANHVIGKDNNLPWHLPADLHFFMQTIENAFLITGRKSYESAQGEDVFGSNRQFAIITRNKCYQSRYGKIVHSLEEAVEQAEATRLEKCCILGGATIYQKAMDIADALIITEIYQQFKGDTFFPPIDLSVWEETKRKKHKKDKENPFDYAFVYYKRKIPLG